MIFIWLENILELINFYTRNDDKISERINIEVISKIEDWLLAAGEVVAFGISSFTKHW